MVFNRTRRFQSRNAIRKVVANAVRPKTFVPKAVKKYVQKRIEHDAEDHYFDVTASQGAGGANYSSAGTVEVLSAVAQGDSYSGRTGEQINPKSLMIRFYAQGNPSWTNPSNLRVIVFQDMQIRSSTLPTVADILETTSYISDINHIAVNAKRFRILMDRHVVLDPTAANLYADGSGINFNLSRKLNGKITYTNSSTGTQKGNIFMLVISDQATNTPGFTYYSRLVFDE